jgi:hypothetical protein
MLWINALRSGRSIFESTRNLGLNLSAGICKEPLLGENIEDSPKGSDIQGLSADLLEAARRRNLSANSLAAYERTWGFGNNGTENPCKGLQWSQF